MWKSAETMRDNVGSMGQEIEMINNWTNRILAIVVQEIYADNVGK